MSYFYKVPAIYEYEVEHVEIKDGERLSKDEEIEVDEETGKRYRNIKTDKVISVRPDIPPGHSYVCELMDDGETFFVKANKPIRFEKDRESLVESVKSLDATRKGESLSRIDPSRGQQWYARGRG